MVESVLWTAHRWYVRWKNIRDVKIADVHKGHVISYYTANQSRRLKKMTDDVIKWVINHVSFSVPETKRIRTSDVNNDVILGDIVLNNM